jgi:two-component system cell cycle response regulator DivK
VSDSTPATAILIVEDNERNLKLVRDILQYHGYETIEARTAADGVALAAEHQPDLILMDIQLPDVDGVTALSRLRGDPRTATIGVVALTAFAMTDDRQHLLAAGFDAYLEKPIDVKAFPGQVSAFLQSTRLEGSR